VVDGAAVLHVDKFSNLIGGRSQNEVSHLNFDLHKIAAKI
jgi:hypothetical protein